MAIKDRPITSVLTEVVSELAYLVQTEIRLAKAEVSEKMAAAANAGVMIGAGAILLLAGLFVFLLAIVSWLAVAGLPEEWGFLIVGLVALGIGAAIAMRGVNGLKASRMMPEKTMNQMRADYSIMKEQVK